MRIGIIGGAGMLGRTIAFALLEKGVVGPGELWISNRSGRRDQFDAWPAVHVTSDNDRLIEACDVVLLSLPPSAVAGMFLEAGDRLVISVMAGVPLARLQSLTGTERIVRAMSSPAAELGLAYSPWIAGPGVSEADRGVVAEIFGACGLTDEVAEETLIDVFTALTGPVPGFAAFFADCMTRFALDQGVPPEIARRSVAQLFLASGTMLTRDPKTASAHVQEMIDYAGTTAAGLVALRGSNVAEKVAKGLAASVAKARSMI